MCQVEKLFFFSFFRIMLGKKVSIKLKKKKFIELIKLLLTHNELFPTNVYYVFDSPSESYNFLILLYALCVTLFVKCYCKMLFVSLCLCLYLPLSLSLQNFPSYGESMDVFFLVKLFSLSVLTG